LKNVYVTVYSSDIEECDIRNTNVLIEEICSKQPTLVFHLAAMTDVDECERHPELAYSINTLGTRNVALACQNCGATMVYINTGSIYNGEKSTPYTEFDKPDPINVYGKSKYQGELYVRDLLNKFYIFYICWLFGGGSDDKKFVARMFQLIKEKNELKVVNDTYGSPTYTKDLAKALTDFSKSGIYGRYNCVNRGCVNRFEITKEIIKITNNKDCHLKPVPSSQFPLPAPRPRMEALRNYHFELLGLDILRDWRSALSDYIETLSAQSA
jgi:dTDP-4-dehydrorhamnose reductase